MMEIDEKLVNEARAGDVDAMLKVADYIVFSDRTQPIEPELLEQAQEYYRKAIAANDWRAMLNVGVMYYEGRGVEQDYAKALHWYQKAADRGSVTAMSNLGYCYYYGRSVPVDYEKAYELYARAALLGDLSALYKLGDMYLFGRYVQKMHDIAFLLYSQCYERIDEDPYVMPDISLRIGGCYLRGEGVPADPDMALRLLDQAKCGFRERLDDGDRFASGSLKRAEEAWAEAYKALNGSEA